MSRSSTSNGVLLAEDVTGGSGTGHFYYTLDNLNSVRQITNSTGTVTASYSYDPYGNTTSGAVGSTVHNPYGYASGYVDKTGLIKFGARYYGPSLQRWTQQDPMTGSARRPTTTNRYTYAGGNPDSSTDPSGHSASDLAVGCLGEAVTAGIIAAVIGGLGAVGVGAAAGLGCVIGAAAAELDEQTGFLGSAFELVADTAEIFIVELLSNIARMRSRGCLRGCCW
jgi:RHS repeat-associated protein